MCAERGQNGFELIPIIFIGVAGKLARAGVSAGLVRWDDEYALALTECAQGLEEQIVELDWSKFCGAATGAEIKAHER
jgi:hypothetical protein